MLAAIDTVRDMARESILGVQQLELQHEPLPLPSNSVINQTLQTMETSTQPVPVTAQQMYELAVQKAASDKGLSVSEYLRLYDPTTGTLREFNPNTPAETGVDIVVKSTPKPKPEEGLGTSVKPPPFVKTPLFWILIAAAALAIVIVIVKLKKK